MYNKSKQELRRERLAKQVSSLVNKAAKELDSAKQKHGNECFTVASFSILNKLAGKIKAINI